MRTLIRRLSRENVLWSAETIHGHLVLLGFDPPCPDTIRKYMVKTRGGTDKCQTWLTFLRNHLQVSWAMDFFTVPTLCFQILECRLPDDSSDLEASDFDWEFLGNSLGLNYWGQNYLSKLAEEIGGEGTTSVSRRVSRLFPLPEGCS